ncbi:hypothetical protein GCM10011332_21170 [Terasakiella brassicae]|uniref:Uncharacterized protein n=1 Tax=Terasakiella brassicae TaxID=1634917 RepID=A0A917C1X0_9PROT|nr:hypothetical protein [Terasakiella brassicae]GGF66828.1 hypothetical protein GCM10011332_21170 [Terasakiella brassicae]
MKMILGVGLLAAVIFMTGQANARMPQGWQNGDKIDKFTDKAEVLQIQNFTESVYPNLGIGCIPGEGQVHVVYQISRDHLAGFTGDLEVMYRIDGGKPIKEDWKIVNGKFLLNYNGKAFAQKLVGGKKLLMKFGHNMGIDVVAEHDIRGTENLLKPRFKQCGINF